MHTNRYAHMYRLHIHVRMDLQMHKCIGYATHRCELISIHVYMHLHTCALIDTHIHMHTHMHTHTHTYIHIHTHTHNTIDLLILKYIIITLYKCTTQFINVCGYGIIYGLASATDTLSSQVT